MKAITIWQPWAELIARGVKLVENRTWRTHYRGPVAIHAGLSNKWFGTTPHFTVEQCERTSSRRDRRRRRVGRLHRVR